MTPNPVPSIPSREAVEAERINLRGLSGVLASQQRQSACAIVETADYMLRGLLAEVERLTKFNKDMVAKVAEGSLDGYRELGERAAHAENERDTLRATVAAQAAALQVIAAIPIEEFRKQDNAAYPLMVWNGHELNVGHVLAARTALAQSASQRDAPGATQGKDGGQAQP
jgi:hypothetical protein